jgi:uncharacterized protein (TIGR00661 family)
VKKRILIAPLDWGLGHATRCIPIIQTLLDKGHEVCIATSGLALPLLKQEFPHLTFFELPSYNARYSSSLPLIVKILLQVPHFLLVIRQEHKAIEKLVAEHGIEVILSDNRFGCYSKKVKSIFITHQLTIRMPDALRCLQGVINFFNHRMIRNYQACWVPDVETDSITGEMTKASGLNVTFIGMLSRFRKTEAPVQKKYDLLVLLSGPEPQRSIFEKIVGLQLKNYTGRYLVVRGLPQEKASEYPHAVNHLPAKELQQVIEASEVVLSRSGYTTVMDLYFLKKKAIFVPTPGQTEQEYLAEQLMKRGIAYAVKQDQFDLQKALAESKNSSGFQQNDYNGAVLESLLENI